MYAMLVPILCRVCLKVLDLAWLGQAGSVRLGWLGEAGLARLG